MRGAAAIPAPPACAAEPEPGVTGSKGLYGRAAEETAIGARLFLSHLTVGYHLYKAYPKLGITSRTQLPAVFARETRANGTR